MKVSNDWRIIRYLSMKTYPLVKYEKYPFAVFG